jgi:hypothetical protein
VAVIGPGIVALGVLALTGLLLAVQLRSRRGVILPSRVPDLQPELDRARRYGHVFTIVRLPAADDRGVADVSTRLRSTDLAWVDGSELYVFVPELAGGAIERFIRRLADDGAAPPWEDVATATFPSDGLTLPALFAQLGQVTRREAPRGAERETDPIVARTAS